MAGGRPIGSTRPKIMTDALILALNRHAADGQTKKLSLIADALVNKAAEGDVQAIREVYDRVDGKPAQTTVLQGDEDGGPIVFDRVERVIVRSGEASPKDTDRGGV